MRKLHSTLCLLLLAGSTQLMAQTSEIGGQVFGDYFYVSQHADSIIDGLAAFSIRRVYFTFDRKWNDKYSLRVRFEANDALGEPINYRVESNGTRVSNRLDAFMKNVFLTINNVIWHSKLQLGLIPTLPYAVEENIWELRSVEKTILDLNGLVPTADFGASLEGAFRERGRLRYQLMAVNGNGLRNESDNSKRLSTSLLYNTSNGFMIASYGDYQFRDGEVANAIRALPNTPARATGELYTLAVFAGLKRSDFRVGLRLLQQTTVRQQMVNGVVSTFEPRARGISGFAVIQPAPRLGVFGRFDWFDPNEDLQNDGYSLFIAGLDFSPFETIHFMPNLWSQNYQAAGRASTTVLRMTFEFKY